MAKRKKTNYFYSIISVALVLFLLGFFGAALLFARQRVGTEQEHLNLMVELKDGADSADLVSLRPLLEKNDFVKEGTVKFVSKEEAHSQMIKQFPEEEVLLKDGPIPFYDSYSLNLKSDYLASDSVEMIRQKIKTNAAVSDVYIDESTLNEIAHSIEKIAYFALAMALMLIIVAITLIHNTIRLNLYSDRFTIKNMELVGASWGFISRPYIKKGVWNGFLSAVLALVMIATIWFFAQKTVPELNLLLKSPVLWGSTGALILLGVFISWLSTFYVVNKYLKMRLDDLY